MSFGKLTEVIVWTDTGDMWVGVEAEFPMLGVRARVNGGEELFFSYETGDSVYVDPWVVGGTYTLTIQVLSPDGWCPEITTVIVAGAEPYGGTEVGFVLYQHEYGYGSASVVDVQVALPPPAVGPETPTPVFALVPYRHGMIPNHPDVPLTPPLSLPEENSVACLYYKTPAGQETFRLVDIPWWGPDAEGPHLPFAQCFIGPDAAVYFFYNEELPPDAPDPRLVNYHVRLYRCPSSEYGVVPEPPSVYVEYTVPNVGVIGASGVFWDDDDSVVVSSLLSIENSEATTVYTVAVANTTSLTVTERSATPYGAGDMAHTEAGVLWFGGGRPI